MNVHNEQTHQPHTPQYHPVTGPVKKPSFLRKLPIPVVAQVAGMLSLVVLMAGLLTANQLSKTSQDLSSQAAPGPENLQLKLDPATMTMSVNEEKQFKVVVNTQSQSMTAAKLILKYPSEFVELKFVTPTANDKFPVVLQPFKPNWFNSVRDPYSAGVTVGVNPNRPVVDAAATVATFTVKAKKKGTAQVALDDLNTEGAHFNFHTDTSKSSGALAITINDAPPPPTGTVCWNFVVTEPGTNRLVWPNACKGTPPNSDLVCAAVITPLTEQEITQYNAWKSAGSVVPAVCGGTVPDPELTLKLQIQGILKAGVTETGELAVRYPNQQNVSQKVTKTYPITFVSDANGIFTSQPVKLTGLPEPLNGEMELFVKTPTTLRQKVGIIGKYSFDRTTHKLTKDYSRTAVLFVGDFDRSPGQENAFRMVDVSLMLSQYKTVTNQVNDQNRQYDVDRNGVINILDVSIILNNYDRVSRVGETL